MAGADEYPDTGIEGYPVHDDCYRPWSYDPRKILRNVAEHVIVPVQLFSRYVRERWLAGRQDVLPERETAVERGAHL